MADGRDSNGWVNCNMIQVCFANEAWGVHPRTTTEELESKPTEAWFRHPRLASFPTFTTPTTYEQSPAHHSPDPQRRRVPLGQVALVDEPRHHVAGLNVAVVVQLVDVGVDNKREAAADEVGVAVAEGVDEPVGHGVVRPALASSQPGRRTL
ncbi:unnamed protein product [Phytophthora fragariaefolia]|uniref:Unnamed protein product n=1 Tax=Phytophthora fragariaefolia TaxID=1490495 RepID=A0A9W6Y681_9STRA|nr:unnamed protein product [Phytophthora fragariaefolia]